MASYTKEMPEMIDEVTDDEETEEKMEKGQR